MNAQLAELMDELGLKILIDDYVGRAHHHPDLAQMPRFCDPRRALDARLMFPPPPPISLTLLSTESHKDYELQRFTFPTPVKTPFPEDETVYGSLFLTHQRPARGTVILAHGGFLGAQPRGADVRPYVRWAIELARQGLHAVLPALPRHLERTPAGTFSGERFLSGDLLETIDVIGQAVSELEALAEWLLEHGLGPLGLLGMSLGGLTAVQLLAVSHAFSAAMLLAPVPDASRSLFESPIGRSIRVDWQAAGATRADLDAVFKPLSPACRPPQLPPGALRLVYGLYDQVVLPDDVQAMGRLWGAEVWEAKESHLGLISAPDVRSQGARWFADRLAEADTASMPAPIGAPTTI